MHEHTNTPTLMTKPAFPSSSTLFSMLTVVMLGQDFSIPGWNRRDKILKRGSPQLGLHHFFLDILSDLGPKHRWNNLPEEKTLVTLY